MTQILVLPKIIDISDTCESTRMIRKREIDRVNAARNIIQDINNQASKLQLEHELLIPIGYKSRIELGLINNYIKLYYEFSKLWRPN